MFKIYEMYDVTVGYWSRMMGDGCSVFVSLCLLYFVTAKITINVCSSMFLSKSLSKSDASDNLD